MGVWGRISFTGYQLALQVKPQREQKQGHGPDAIHRSFPGLSGKMKLCLFLVFFSIHTKILPDHHERCPGLNGGSPKLTPCHISWEGFSMPHKLHVTNQQDACREPQLGRKTAVSYQKQPLLPGFQNWASWDQNHQP